jgi:hypothetical protein
MIRRFTLLFLATALTAVALPAGAGANTVDLPGSARCASGTLRSAAQEVFGGGTEIVARDTTAGLEGARVLEPRIAPGTRARLLRVGDSWCEATSSFNLAWAEAGGSFEGSSAAQAYVQIAAAPYFDGITVKSLNEVVPGTYEIVTHARTNGVVARWLVVQDGDGIRSAVWTATDYAVQPFEAQTEGLTALPGGTETYTRTALGLLSSLRGLPMAESARKNAAPGIAEYVSPDDFVISVSVGDTRVALDPGQDTGVRKADVVRENLKALKINYEEFYKWGMRKGWGELEPVSGSNKGYLYINDALSFYCFACVFIADDFQIHMLSEVEVILNALGYSYPEGVEAYQNIIGHEMFHNFQNRYNKPGPLGRSANRGTPTAYSEGTARAQEALHSYSKVSHQEQSLIYATDSNGCNGFQGGNFDAAMTSGLYNKGYSNCFFWLSWYGAEGTDGLVRLVSKAYPKVSDETNTSIEGIKALEIASKESPAEQLARFAGAAITSNGYKMNGFDWSKFLTPWKPFPLEVGDTVSGTLQQSGLFARELASSATVSLTKDSKAELFVVIQDGSKTTTRVIDSGSVCIKPKPGEKVWVGAVRVAKDSGGAEIVTRKATC